MGGARPAAQSYGGLLGSVSIKKSKPESSSVMDCRRYFLYKKLVRKQTEKAVPLIEIQFDEIYEICEKVKCTPCQGQIEFVDLLS